MTMCCRDKEALKQSQNAGTIAKAACHRRDVRKRVKNISKLNKIAKNTTAHDIHDDTRIHILNGWM